MLHRDLTGQDGATTARDAGQDGQDLPDRRSAVQDRRSAVQTAPIRAEFGCQALATPSETRNPSMATLIADEIIPRLIAAHRAEVGPDGPGRLLTVDPVHLAELAVQSDSRHLADVCEAAMANGLGFEALMLDVMTPAARILGERWSEDRVDFVEVTLALWRLQELVHELAARRCGVGAVAIPDRRVLCAVAPGDDHSFGSLILEEMFRSAGWTCGSLRGGSRAELLWQVGSGWYDIIALTVSVEDNSEALIDLVTDLRMASCNPGVSIMVGGPVFNDNATLADEIGADATASNARAALHQAELLVGQYLLGSDRLAGRAGPRRAGGHPAARAGIQPG